MFYSCIALSEQWMAWIELGHDRRPEIHPKALITQYTHITLLTHISQK